MHQRLAPSLSTSALVSTFASSVTYARRCIGRFVFSEGYLKSVGSDLALNILCAVANPLGAEGMLRIVRGALKSRDLTKDLKSVALPIVLVQVRLKLVYPPSCAYDITSLPAELCYDPLPGSNFVLLL